MTLNFDSFLFTLEGGSIDTYSLRGRARRGKLRRFNGVVTKTISFNFMFIGSFIFVDY